jgi:hypothetical protein
MRALPTLARLGLGLASLAASLAASSVASAQPKPPAKVTSVCPGKMLPLAIGNSWTYESVQARDAKGNPVLPREELVKLRPLPATKIVVTVVATDTDKKTQETTVKLEETITYDITKDQKAPKLFPQKVESTIVCSPKGKFEISPQSFFFSGEPGGFRGISFSKLERKKETTLKLTNNVIGETEWIEEIAGEYQQETTKGSGAKLTGGKLEMERKFQPAAAEGVQTRTLLYQVTEKLRLTTSGRIMLDTKVAPDGKPCSVKKTIEEEKKPADPKAAAAADPKAAAEKKPGEKAEEPVKKVIDVPTETCGLPADWDADLWLANDVGFVQTLHYPWAHMYQLVEVKLN